MTETPERLFTIEQRIRARALDGARAVLGEHRSTPHEPRNAVDLITVAQWIIDGHDPWTSIKLREGDKVEPDDDVRIACTVHYVSYGTPGGEYPSVCRAAIVTEVTPSREINRRLGPGVADDDDGVVVGLCVLNPTGMFFNREVNQSEEDHRGGTWHWPDARCAK